MNCEELARLLPDLVDGTLAPEVRAEAEAALPGCPDCQRDLEIARQIRTLLVTIQAEYRGVRVPPGFEARLLERIQAERTGLELLDLSSLTFAQWLVDLLNLIGALLDPGAAEVRPQPA
jgi:anti-sigma factor RsiW